MYLKHYNLTLKPFEISPDPKFLWLGEKHQEALAIMRYGILENKGFIFLTGDVGSGKTTLVNALANILKDSIVFTQVPDPTLEPLNVLNLTADPFKMNKRGSTKGDFLGHLRHSLHNAYVHQKKVVVVIENAQRLDQERLEAVRLNLNLQPDKKLINIVFVGQNEFKSILTKNKSLAQRITIVYKIIPLQEIETEQYVRHRLRIAGSEKMIFTPEAVRGIYSFSKGNPRLINLICDFALLTGYTKEKKIIESEVIKDCESYFLLAKQQKEAAIEDLRVSAKSIPKPETLTEPASSLDSYQKVAEKVPIKHAGLKLAYVTPMFAVILLSIFGYFYLLGENHAPYRSLKTFLGQAFARMTGSESKTSLQMPHEINIRQGDKAEPQVQILNLKTQKTSHETQLGQLRSSDDQPAADLKELKNANALVAENEGLVAMREPMLIELTEELDREKKKMEHLSSELFSKVDLITELQQTLANSQPDTLEFEAEIENSKIKINELQEQLSDIKAEKTSAEARLGQLRSRHAELNADLNELKGTKEQVAALEGLAARREKTLYQSEQKIADLANALEREKKGQELLRAELSKKAELVTEIQQKLQTSQGHQQELEKRFKKSKKEIEELENQLRELKAQQARTEFSPVIVDVKKKSTTGSE